VSSSSSCSKQAVRVHQEATWCQRCPSGSLVAWLQQQLGGGREQQQAGSCSRPEEALVVQKLEVRALHVAGAAAAAVLAAGTGSGSVQARR
jgi:hypothetical protein